MVAGRGATEREIRERHQGRYAHDHESDFWHPRSGGSDVVQRQKIKQGDRHQPNRRAQPANSVERHPLITAILAPNSAGPQLRAEIEMA